MTLEALTKELETFAKERDWDQYHSPKNFAMALMVEAAELMDPLQWVGHEDSRELVKNPEVKAYLTKEVGDVLINLLQFARYCEIDVEQAAQDKLATLKVRYKPDGQSGGHRKINEDGTPMFENVVLIKKENIS